MFKSLFFKMERRVLWLGMMNLVSGAVLMTWCQTTNSMGLSAFTLLTLLDLLSIATSLLSSWVDKRKPDAVFTFGYERFEVLAVFASTILAQLCSLLVVKESFERFIVQPEVHVGRLLPGVTLAFGCHIMVMYGINNRAFDHVIATSSSSWLQEHVAEISQSICNVLPGLSTFLLPRVNPFLLLGWAGTFVLWITHMLIENYYHYWADTAAGIIIALMVTVTVFPMSGYSGRILLQTIPAHVTSQLDKCLREASTLDGVLEFRNEHFWTVTFGKLAGSIHVRISRDANEQLVLAHLVDRLSNLVSDLTVQVFKDEWAWSTTAVLSDSSLRLSGGSILTKPLPASEQISLSSITIDLANH